MFLSLGLLGLATATTVAQTPPRVRPDYGQQQAGPQVQPLQVQPLTLPGQNQGVRPAQQANQPRPPAGPPKGFALTPQQANMVDQMLKFWQQKTEGVKTLEAEFGRYVFDPVFGPKDAPKTFTTGLIRYAAPDKGMIQEKDLSGKKGTGVYKYSAALAKTNPKWPFEEDTKAVGEHWVCDGSSVFEFSHKTKELIEIKLPPEMQGNAIAEGPLPFMFGAKAAMIKSRYWVREIPRKGNAGPFQLELVPKRRGEDFSKISIKLDAAKFLPTEMTLYDLNKVGRSQYVFRNLTTDGAKNKLTNFLGGFVSPKTPRGWTKIVQDIGKPGTDPGSRQAQAPAQPAKR